MSPLPVGLELGPVLGHRRVDVEVAALGEQVGARGGGALGGGEHQLEAVLRVRRAGVAVGDPAPQVDDLAAADVHRRRPRPPRRAPRSWRGTRPPRPRSRARPSPRSPSCHPPRPRVAAQAGSGCTTACKIRRAGTATLLRTDCAGEHDEEEADRHGGHRGADRRCRSGGPGAARPPPRPSPAPTDTSMHTHARRTSSRAVAGGPTSRPNTSRLPADGERRHDGDRDQARAAPTLREVRAEPEAGRLALVEREREERAVAHHARDHHDERPRPPAPRCRPSRRGRCRRTGAAPPPPRATRRGR